MFALPGPNDYPQIPALAERGLQRVQQFMDTLERRLAGASNRIKAAGKLVTIALQKRLLSSVEAFARTLNVHRRNAAKTSGAAVPSSSDAPSAKPWLSGR